MASTTLLQIHYPREVTELRDEARVIAWLEAIAAQGYCVAEQDELSYEQWGEALRAHSLTPTVSSLARSQAQAFCGGERESLDCTAHALDEDFHIDPCVSMADEFVILVVDDGYFTFGDRHLHFYERFVQAVEVTYQSWHPIYGFDIGGGFPIPETTRADALALTARDIYNINVFGPEFVRQLGRDRLLSAPAWRVKEFDDGGILIVPTTYFVDNWRAPSPYSLAEVARHIGVPYVPPTVHH